MREIEKINRDCGWIIIMIIKKIIYFTMNDAHLSVSALHGMFVSFWDYMNALMLYIFFYSRLSPHNYDAHTRNIVVTNYKRKIEENYSKQCNKISPLILEIEKSIDRHPLQRFLTFFLCWMILFFGLFSPFFVMLSLPNILQISISRHSIFINNIKVQTIKC